MTTNGSFGSRLGFTRRRLLALGAATSASAFDSRRPRWRKLASPLITEGNVAPIPMAIRISSRYVRVMAKFRARHDAGHHQQSAPFRAVQPIDPAAYIEKITNFDTQPRFPDWRQINAQGLRHGPHHAPSATAGCAPNSGCGTCSPAAQLTAQQYFTAPDKLAPNRAHHFGQHLRAPDG